MQLRYDFDMFSLFAEPSVEQAGGRRRLWRSGQASDALAHKVPMFRDRATLAALERAPQAVQDFMHGLGFGYDVHDSGAPTGRFPAGDQASRAMLMMRLTGWQNQMDLPDEAGRDTPENEFSLRRFLEAAQAARVEDLPPYRRPPALDALAPLEDGPSELAHGGSNIRLFVVLFIAAVIYGLIRSL